jgi:superfamily II DNA or RNA helicase
MASGLPGVYIAHHRWLDTEFGVGQLFKVGHTGDLGARLTDGAYVTCFPSGWVYVASFELATKADAHLLETAVLHYFRDRRLDGRELIHASLDELIQAACAVAPACNLFPTLVREPVYAVAGRPAAGVRERERGLERELEPSVWDAVRARVDALEPAPDCAPTANALIDDILSWDFSELAVAAPPAPAPAPAPALDTETESEPETEFADEFDLDDPYDVVVAPSSAFTLRDYQQAAVDRCVEDLREHGNAILQMACRCGKTPVAFRVMSEQLNAQGACGLFLVPGLSLLRQTAQKFAGYGFSNQIMLIGSDPRPVHLTDGRTLMMTTDPAAVLAFVRANDGKSRLVISTYQSSHLVPTDAFALTVFDEAHRVCGGRRARPFNYTVLAPQVGARLFMTATPALEAPGDAVITMKDRSMFGGVAYKYHLRRGIDAGHVNNFRLKLVPAQLAEVGAPAEEAAMVTQLLAALIEVDKLLVFCRNIAHAKRLHAKLLAATTDVTSFESILVAHSKMGNGGVAAALKRFSAQGTRSVLFNCKLFQEGVEIPALTGVFYASPRHSRKDIIQSLCRPLNVLAGKPTSVIFLPVFYNDSFPLDDIVNLKRYASIVPFVDALLDEDPTLYEHILDPDGSAYPLSVLGSHSLGLVDEDRKSALLGAVRRAVRYNGTRFDRDRLTMAAAIPWDIGFSAVREIVNSQNRYPKRTETALVHGAAIDVAGFHSRNQKQYLIAMSGGVSTLEPWQIAQLESLPQWSTAGAEGPYPFERSMAYLEAWGDSHEGEFPMISVGNGESIELDATPLERLSGIFRIINQQDGKRGFRVTAAWHAELDRVFGLFEWRWRKPRNKRGDIDPAGRTDIQLGNARYQQWRADYGPKSEYMVEHFPHSQFRTR